MTMSLYEDANKGLMGRYNISGVTLIENRLILTCKSIVGAGYRGERPGPRTRRGNVRQLNCVLLLPCVHHV